MKRILIFAAYFYPHVGGYENNVYELSRRLVKRDYEIDILTCNTEKVAAYEELDGIHVYRLPCWNALNSTYPIPKPSLIGFRIFRELVRKKYDVVNTQTRFFATSFIGLIFAKLRKTPLVHTEHGATHSIVSNKVVDLISRSYDHIIGAMIVKSARVNIGVSEAACSFLKHLGASNVQLIYNGIDITIFKKRDTDYRRKLGINNNAILVTFVGRLIYAKGVQDLISAFPKIRTATHDTKLLIVGDGPYKANLEKLAYQNDCRSDILFLGQKNQDDIIDILNATDVFVNPSYSEGFGMSVLEAASVGLPIVTTDVGNTRKIVEDGRSGLFIKIGEPSQIANAASFLARNRQMREQFGKRSRYLTKERFDWDKLIDRWISSCIPQLAMKEPGKG